MFPAPPGSAGGTGGGGLSGPAAAGIAGGAAGVAIGVAALVGGEAPPVVVMSPTGTGIRGVTVFTFIASGEFENTSEHSWDFGDGGRASGSPATHVFASEGRFSVSVTTGGASSVIATADVNVGRLSGTWIAPTGGGVTHRLVMTQQGNQLDGQWHAEVPPGSPFTPGVWPLSGTISDPRRVSLFQLGECLRGVTGSADELLTSISGAVQGSSTCGLSATYTFAKQ